MNTNNMLKLLLHCAIFCSLITHVFGQTMPKKKKFYPIKEDIPFIKCQVCQKGLRSIFKTVKQMREESNVKLEEEEILAVVEKSCDVKSKHAEWITRLDVTSEGDGLKLVEHSKEGRCTEECQTIAHACDDVIIDHDTDIGEMLWKNELTLSQLTNKVCFTLSGACETKKSKKKRGKRKDFKFIEMSEKEKEAMGVMSKMNGIPGMPGMEMYTPEDLAQMREQMGMPPVGESAGESSEVTEEEKEEMMGEKSEEPQPKQYSTQVGFFDLVTETFHNSVAKVKSLFGYGGSSKNVEL